MGFDGRKVIIKPIGHKHTELMPIECIAPTWKNNDDLRQKYNVLVEPETQELHADDWPPLPEAIDLAPELFSETAEQPPAQNPTDDIRQPRMIINSHTANWLPTYQKYLVALNAEANDRALLQEVLSALSIHCEEQSKIVEELKLLGVEIIDDVPCGHVEIKVDVDPAPTSSDSSRNRGKIAVDKLVLDWARNIKTKLQYGDTLVGNVGNWAVDLGIAHKSLQSRLDLISKVMKLSFTDSEGRTGCACRRKITVKIK